MIETYNELMLVVYVQESEVAMFFLFLLVVALISIVYKDSKK